MTSISSDISPENSGRSASWIEKLWRSVRELASSRGYIFTGKTSVADQTKILAEALISERGEAAGAVVAQELQECYLRLDDAERAEFYGFLVERFLPVEPVLRSAAAAYLESSTPESASALARAAEPPRQELLRRWNMAPAGTATLVKMHGELLKLQRDNSSLQPLTSDLHHLLASWFNPGFLELHQISWQTPAAILEKLIEYEAVHEIQGWPDLRRRLEKDRRCFAFFHPGLPDEPLIFVEVALTHGLASSVQTLLEQEEENGLSLDASKFDTAIFYSISNCQQGLKGISFGNFLIKQVVQELKSELPQLSRFATLSPIPGFRRWLEKVLSPESESFLISKVLTEREQKLLLPVPEGTQTDRELKTAFAELLASESRWSDPASPSPLKTPLLRLCAIYLTTLSDVGKPLDPVARFHLHNGAKIEKIHWAGNSSSRGITESFGLMVNYLYDLDSIETNHENFVKEGEVASSKAIDSLLKST